MDQSSIVVLCIFGGLVIFAFLAGLAGGFYEANKYRRASKFLGIEVPVHPMGNTVEEKLKVEATLSIGLLKHWLQKASGFTGEQDFSTVAHELEKGEQKFKNGGRLCLRADLRKAMKEVRGLPTIRDHLLYSIKRIMMVQEVQSLIERPAFEIEIIT